MRIPVIVPLCLLLASCGARNGSGDIDSGLASEIARIKAIDNHAHPAWGDSDHEFDALPVEAMEPGPLPARLDPANPEFKTASAAKSAAAILDDNGIETMLANRVAMSSAFDPARFKWVPFVDALMYPCNNESLGKRDPDRKTFFAAEEKLLKRYLDQAGLSAMPNTFDDYLAFVTKTLERQRSQGAVAEKFEMAYLRTLAVGAPSKVEADRVYSIYSRSGAPVESEYKSLQDFIFRYIALECGRLGMPVHIHTSAGAGGYFEVSGANPMLLEPLFNDPALRKTQFVMLHGGWPWMRELQALLTKPNVWADFSVLGLLVYPHELAQGLRGWIEAAPDKILFGTDSGPFAPGVGLEQTARVAVKSARDALGIALTGMIRDGEISREQAGKVAAMVLRDNARKLYGWK